MPYDDSLEEHRIAGISLRNGMRERVRLVTSALAERCYPFERWTHEARARWDDPPELQQLRLAQASFHAIALAVTLSVTNGRLADAAAMLEPDALFETAARRLAHAVSCFEIHLEAEAALAPKSPIHEGRRDSSVAAWLGLTETDLH